MLSIITLTKDNPLDLRKTLSTLDQQLLSSSSVEYIVYDGSRQFNLECEQIVKNYSSGRIKYAHSLDSGIYSAINNSVNYASYPWIIHIHAGDQCLLDLYKLNEVLRYLKSLPSCYEMVAGHGYCEYYNYGISFCKKYTSNPLDLSKKMSILHEALFVKKAFYSKFSYSQLFKIASDYMFLLEHQSKLFPYPINIYVVNHALDGVSSSNHLRRIRENFSIRRIFQGNYLAIKFLLKSFFFHALFSIRTKLLILILGKKKFAILKAKKVASA